MPTDVAIEAVEAGRMFRTIDARQVGLRPVSWNVPAGCMAAVHGRSGSGKTTLLNLIGGLDVPTSGHVSVLGAPVPMPMSGSHSARWRARTLGFVFQADGLLPTLSAAENVEVALRLAGVRPRRLTAAVAEALDAVGIAARAAHRPAELSGGQRRRVAIARAIAARQPVVLADEPTAGLDSAATLDLIGVFARLVAERGTTVVIATHDPVVRSACAVQLLLGAAD